VGSRRVGDRAQLAAAEPQPGDVVEPLTEMQRARQRDRVRSRAAAGEHVGEPLPRRRVHLRIDVQRRVGEEAAKRIGRAAGRDAVLDQLVGHPLERVHRRALEPAPRRVAGDRDDLPAQRLHQRRRTRDRGTRSDPAPLDPELAMAGDVDVAAEHAVQDDGRRDQEQILRGPGPAASQQQRVAAGGGDVVAHAKAGRTVVPTVPVQVA
jgi:hypothetical protein